MESLTRPDEMRRASDTARAQGKRIGMVPTMGFLHAGHIALVERARTLCDVVVTSIFVNPTQFAPGEDLARYPRDPEGDLRKLETAGCDVVFVPDARELYPSDFSTYVTVGNVSRLYEGEFRPTHFRGVATVVAKLFNIVRPHVAVFGRKDAQQVAVIRRMVRDLDMGIEIDAVDTIRDADGLAMSSRNVYLSDEERRRALVLSHSLRNARDVVTRGGTLIEARRAMRDQLGSEDVAVDYADIVEAESFEPASEVSEGSLLAIVAARVGATRLIDNMEVRAS